MKIQTNHAWTTLVGCFSVHELTFEEARKRILFGFLCIISSALALSFGLYHFTQNEIVESILDLSLGVILAYCVYGVRQCVDARNFYRIPPIIFSVLFLYVATLGDPGGYRMQWLYIFPPISFFLVGWREGSVYTLLVFGGWVCAMLIPSSVSGPAVYDSAFSVRFVASFLVVLGVSWFAEVVREFYASAMDAHSSRLEKDKSRMRDLAYLDELTKLPNRRAAIQKLTEVLEPCEEQSEKKPLVAMLDIDHFKMINDQYGHLVGDQVLIRIAQRIRGAIRSEDFVGRFGGEEFLIVVGPVSPDKYMAILDKIRLAICSTQIKAGKVSLPVSASIGGVCAEFDISNSEVIHSADRALYRAKQNGRNQVIIAEDDDYKVNRDNVITFASP